jgi:serine/threonine protein kinase
MHRFPQKVFLAITAKDAYEIYQDTAELPQTETELQLNFTGVQLNRLLLNNSANLMMCFKETVPMVLKPLTTIEEGRMRAIAKCDLNHKFIVNFEIMNAGKKTFLLMPLYPATLEHLKQLSTTATLQFWEQISSALIHLHNQQIAHMDIKPSNICIDSNGNFVLIDFGSTSFFGEKTSSTQAYIPDGLKVCTAKPPIN